MVDLVLRVALLCSLFSAAVACNKSSFMAEKPLVGGDSEQESAEPSAARSTITVSSPNYADGVTPAIVTITLKTASGRPVAGKQMSLNVSGSNNVIVPCTISNELGLSHCWIYSIRAELKIVSAVSSSLTLSANAIFEALAPATSFFGVTSAGSQNTLVSGHRITSSVGVSETPTTVRDNSGAIRFQTSILGLIIKD